MKREIRIIDNNGESSMRIRGLNRARVCDLLIGGIAHQLQLMAKETGMSINDLKQVTIMTLNRLLPDEDTTEEKEN